MSQVIKLRTRKKQKTIRVAAYCRVSTKFDSQQTSLEEQIRYYSSLINENPGWQLAGVFADQGRTGTNTNRPGFQELIDYCNQGKVDLVLTKSVKRFNRNTLDLLEIVRHLKGIGVGVYFELENIDTRTEEGEMILSFMGSLAQDEIKSMSENQKWSIRKKFAEGESSVHRDCYGYKWDGSQYQPVWDQLEIVKRIFKEFLQGKSYYKIAQGLAADGLWALKGGEWSEGSVRAILDNRSYTGCLLLQKTFTVDPITKKTKRNEGEVDQYLVPDAHIAIIDEPTWQAVQRQKEVNKRKHELNPSHAVGTTEFFRKVYCGSCGETMRKHSGYFRCEQTTSNCRMIRLDELRKAVSAALGRGDYEPELTEEVEKITVYKDYTARVLLKNSNCYRHRLKTTDLSGFVRCANCGEVFKVLRTNARGRLYSPKCKHQKPLYEIDIKSVITAALGLETFDYFSMIDNLTHCEIDNEIMDIYFKDGRCERRIVNGKSGL